VGGLAVSGGVRLGKGTAIVDRRPNSVINIEIGVVRRRGGGADSR